MTPHFDLVVTAYCERTVLGATCFARSYDPLAERFFGGSAVVEAAGGLFAAAIEATCWVVDEWYRRVVLRQPHSMSRDPRAQPGDGLTSHRRSADELAASEVSE